MTTSTADPMTLFLMTVNPFEIDGERYRTSGAILNETPGCATDRQRQDHWRTDNQVAKHKHVMAVYEFHEEQRRQHERQLKRAANQANIEYRQRLKGPDKHRAFDICGERRNMSDTLFALTDFAETRVEWAPILRPFKVTLASIIAGDRCRDCGIKVGSVAGQGSIAGVGTFVLCETCLPFDGVEMTGEQDEAREEQRAKYKPPTLRIEVTA